MAVEPNEPKQRQDNSLVTRSEKSGLYKLRTALLTDCTVVTDFVVRFVNRVNLNQEKTINLHGEEKAAEIWISANGPSSLAQFGGIHQSTRPFFENFKTEFKKFICGHPDYESYRIQLHSESKVINALYISVISAAIGETLGFAAALLAPAVALLLSAVGKMGVKAYCTGFNTDPPVII